MRLIIAICCIFLPCVACNTATPEVGTNASALTTTDDTEVLDGSMGSIIAHRTHPTVTTDEMPDGSMGTIIARRTHPTVTTDDTPDGSMGAIQARTPHH
jgi:hypothetical protein